jgi:hypothetical protein
VAKAMKRLGGDTKQCRSILVLSDALAAFASPDDPSRIGLVWMGDRSGDLTPGERGTRLRVDGVDKAKNKMNKERREHVFQLIAHVDTVLREARGLLHQMLVHDPSMVNPSTDDMHKLVRALVASPDAPSQRIDHERYTRGTTHGRSRAEAVSCDRRVSRPSYCFHSPSHQHEAAQRENPWWCRGKHYL